MLAVTVKSLAWIRKFFFDFFVGPAGLTTWSKERGKRQSEFGMEMQSNEVSGRNRSREYKTPSAEHPSSEIHERSLKVAKKFSTQLAISPNRSSSWSPPTSKQLTVAPNYSHAVDQLPGMKKFSTQLAISPNCSSSRSPPTTQTGQQI